MAVAPGLRVSLFLLLAASSALAQSSVLECAAWGPEGCLEEELNRALESAEIAQELRLTRHLVILRDPSRAGEDGEKRGRQAEETTLERLERFLYSHRLRLDLPGELVAAGKRLGIPSSFLDSLPASLDIPLDGEPVGEEGRSRRFIKNVVLPFVLGLKFKATAVIPVAIGLIALKTWKALTLGLLSLVLSAALVIFRLTRPKVQHYEVLYPPTAGHSHIVDEHYHGRSAQEMAYSAHI